jgi:hypothetical protein
MIRLNLKHFPNRSKILTCSSTVESSNSFCGDPPIGSSGSDLPFISSAQFSVTSGFVVLGTFLASFSFRGISWVWTSGSGEEAFSGPFSSWIYTEVLRDVSGISSSLYMFINSLKGLGVPTPTDTRLASG